MGGDRGARSRTRPPVTGRPAADMAGFGATCPRCLFLGACFESSDAASLRIFSLMKDDHFLKSAALPWKHAHGRCQHICLYYLHVSLFFFSLSTVVCMHIFVRTVHQLDVMHLISLEGCGPDTYRMLGCVQKKDRLHDILNCLKGYGDCQNSTAPMQKRTHGCRHQDFKRHALRAMLAL